MTERLSNAGSGNFRRMERGVGASRKEGDRSSIDEGRFERDRREPHMREALKERAVLARVKPKVRQIAALLSVVAADQRLTRIFMSALAGVYRRAVVTGCRMGKCEAMGTPFDEQKQQERRRKDPAEMLLED